MTKKKALLVVSFGTSYTKVIESCIEPVEQAIRAAAPDYDFFRAFTSRMIINKLEKVNNIRIQTPPQVFERLAEEGYSEIFVAPTHILAGIEYHDLQREVELFASVHEDICIRLGQPMLYENEDYEKAALALGQWMPPAKDDEVVLLMGHGTPHFSNSSYFALQHYLDALDMRVVYMANVEAPPVLSDVIKRMKESNIHKVYLMPFMLVAGDHARNDMSGDSKESWESILKRAGFEVEIILRGLGECEAFCQLYKEKTAKMMNS